MQYDVQQRGSTDSMCWIVHIFHPGLASIVYSSACVGSTLYFAAHAKVASQAENRQGAVIREGADQWYFTVFAGVSTNARRFSTAESSPYIFSVLSCLNWHVAVLAAARFVHRSNSDHCTESSGFNSLLISQIGICL